MRIFTFDIHFGYKSKFIKIQLYLKKNELYVVFFDNLLGIVIEM